MAATSTPNNHFIYPDDVVPLNYAAHADCADVVTATTLGIFTGDLMWYYATDDTVKPANAFTWDTNLLTTQKSFAKLFQGLSVGGTNIGDVARLQSVQQRGVIKMKCASGTYNIGDLFGPDQQSGSGMERAILEQVTDPSAAIAVCVKPTAASSTEVLVRLIIRPQQVLAEFGSVSYSISAESSNAIVVTVTSKDQYGNTIAGVRSFRMFLSATATGGVAATAPNSTVSATIGEAAAITAKVDFIMTTAANGIAALSIAETGSTNFYARSLVKDALVTSSIIAFT